MNKPNSATTSAPAPQSSDAPQQTQNASLLRRFELQRLLSEVSTHFINLPAEEIDGHINQALGRVATFLGFNLAAIAKFSGKGSAGEITHIWTAKGLPPVLPGFTQLDFPWVAERLRQGHRVHLSSLDDLPAAAQRDRLTYERLAIGSSYNWPLQVGGAAVGGVGLCSVGVVRPFPVDFEEELNLLAQVMASALDRTRADQALRESDERLNLAAEAAGSGLWSLNLASGDYWLTDKARELFHLRPDQPLTFDLFLALVHPEDQPAIRQIVQEVVRTKKEGRAEYRVLQPDGTVRWMLSQGRVQCSATGQPNYLMGVTVDITERKRTEAALGTSEARLAAGADLAGLAYYEFDFGERACFIDDRFHDICGVPAGRQQGLQSLEIWMEHLHPDDRQRVLDVRQKLQDGRLDRLSIEYRYLHPVQGQKWIHHLSGVATRDASGRAVRTFGVVCDISERKQAEEALREAQTTLNAIIDSTDDLIWSVGSVSFGLMTFNRGLRDYFFQGRGIRLEPGMRPEDLFPEDEYVQRWRGFYQRALQAGPFTTEYLTHTHSRVLQLSFNVLKRDGAVFGVSVFGKDMTERKQAEAELLWQRAELAHVARVSTMGELAASVAHELNQPLGAILANAEAAELFLQQDPPALDDLRDILADIRRDDERAGEVIRRMRGLLRKRELERLPIEINSLVEDVLQLVSGDAALREVSLTADLGPAQPKVAGDRVHLQQVLLNLILNGMDAMAGQPRERRRVSVRTRLDADGRVELAVIDSGPGIPPDTLTRLFEPFYTTKPNGMGMGLSIARTIIEAHHGRIWAENNASGGAAFRISLPAFIEGTKP